jgi:hypothetical protein
MFSMIKSKILLPLLVIFLSISSNANAASSCPNVQVGIYGNSSRPAIYSDCSMDTGSTTEFWLSIFFLNSSIYVNGVPLGNSAFSPPAAGPTEFGTWDFSTNFVRDMGSSYSGDCTELSSPSGDSPSVSAVQGNTYCGVIGNSNSRKAWLRGTWTGSTFTNPSVLTDEPSVVALSTPPPTPTPPTPTPTPAAIPTLSEWAMIFLASLMGLFAFARIRRQR